MRALGGDSAITDALLKDTYCGDACINENALITKLNQTKAKYRLKKGAYRKSFRNEPFVIPVLAVQSAPHKNISYSGDSNQCQPSTSD